MACQADAYLTIDCGAVVRNWRRLCEIHAPGAVAGVVKADGYGLGAAPIGRALLAAGCRHFFVAQQDEGMALRAALGAGPMIAVLGGGTREGLTPVLNSLADIRSHKGPAILHIDTGMSRLGLDAGELAALAAEPKLLDRIEILYLMTHLAVADEPEHPLNAAQIARFEAACAQLPSAPRSVANSSGMFLGRRFASDLARPGCALYGINPTPGRPNPMESVVRMGARILQIREIPAGQSVGYGASWTAARPSRIATVSLGYADGFHRALGNKARGLVHGRAVPMAGRVSMDLLTFDVTEAPEALVGDRMELIHPGQDADALAAMAGTIGYEMLTSLGRRFQREYLAA